MNNKTVKLGLVGKDVSGSVIHLIHSFILKEWGYLCEYEKISVFPLEFDLTARRLIGDFDGFNVTIPYKRDIMEYLNEVVGDAFLFGAVNTVVSDGATGYNTDGLGFMQMVASAGIDVKGKRVLVLGGGGSGRSSAVKLKQAGAKVFMFQRSRDKLAETCKEIGVTPADDPEKGGYEILVNCTGVGMHDTVGVSPVSEKAFQSAEAAIDLIYNPEETEFLKIAKSCGTKTVNGKAMLFYQAYYADCLFVKKQPDSKEAERLYQKYLLEIER